MASSICQALAGEVTFPPWIMHQAREAWMRQTRDEYRNSTSKSHKEIAKFIGELGVPHKVERCTMNPIETRVESAWCQRLQLTFYRHVFVLDSTCATTER